MIDSSTHNRTKKRSNTLDLSARIAETWLESNGKLSLQQLAEKFKVTIVYIKQVLSPLQKASDLQRIGSSESAMISLARNLYSNVPVELASPFSSRFEDVTGITSGMLLSPSSKL